MPVYEVGQHEGLPYLVSDLVEGTTLADLLTTRRPSPRQSAQLLGSIADALQYAHDMGVVHRDVKPPNVMLQMADRRSQIADGERSAGTWRSADRNSQVDGLRLGQASRG